MISSIVLLFVSSIIIIIIIIIALLEVDTGAKISRTSFQEEVRAEKEELIRRGVNLWRQSEKEESICRIAISESSAGKRLRSDIIRTVKTLDQLTSALNR